MAVSFVLLVLTQHWVVLVKPVLKDPFPLLLVPLSAVPAPVDLILLLIIRTANPVPRVLSPVVMVNAKFVLLVLLLVQANASASPADLVLNPPMIVRIARLVLLVASPMVMVIVRLVLLVNLLPPLALFSATRVAVVLRLLTF